MTDNTTPTPSSVVGAVDRDTEMVLHADHLRLELGGGVQRGQLDDKHAKEDMLEGGTDRRASDGAAVGVMKKP